MAKRGACRTGHTSLVKNPLRLPFMVKNTTIAPSPPANPPLLSRQSSAGVEEAEGDMDEEEEVRMTPHPTISPASTQFGSHSASLSIFT
jgi:hypothetical protein